jgi:hypothetical protein
MMRDASLNVERGKPLVAYLSAADRKAVDRAIAVSGMTTSAYVRAALLGRRTRSVLDLQAVAELSRVSSEQARLTGILSLMPDPSVREILRRILEVQARLVDAASRIKT